MSCALGRDRWPIDRIGRIERISIFIDLDFSFKVPERRSQRTIQMFQQQISVRFMRSLLLLVI